MVDIYRPIPTNVAFLRNFKNQFSDVYNQVQNYITSLFPSLIVLSFITLIFGVYLFFIEAGFVIYYVNNQNLSEWLLIGLPIIFVFIFVIGIFFYIEPIKILKKQKMHNQKSWVYYTYWSIALAPTVAWILNKTGLFQILDRVDRTYSISGYVITLVGNPSKILTIYVVIRNLYLIFCLIWLIGLWCVYKMIKKRNIDDETDTRRFAPYSVGKKRDRFPNIRRSLAKRIASSMLINANRSPHISVYTLDAGQGEGKSSFIRMLAEYLPRSESMYTYISLTETNEARDFSALFSERMQEELYDRYPKVRLADTTAIKRYITRESAPGIISALFEYISLNNKQFIPTENRVWDEYVFRQPYSITSVANIFGNVERINEKIWLVVIDELERSPIDEVFKVFEIVERYKYENRLGAPVKIIFLLSYNLSDLQKQFLLVNGQDKTGKMHLVNMYINDIKNSDQSIILPEVLPLEKIDHFVELMNKQLGQLNTIGKFIFGIKKSSTINNYQKLSETDLHEGIFADAIETETNIKESDRMFKIRDEIVKLSLREIKKITDDFSYSYRFIFPEDTKKLYWADVLGIIYIKNKFPWIYRFMQHTIIFFVEKSEYQLAGIFKSKELEKELRHYTGGLFTETEWNDQYAKAKELFTYFAQFYLNWKDNKSKETGIGRSEYSVEDKGHSTSDPSNLSVLLELTNESGRMLTNTERFMRFKKTNNIVSTFSNEGIVDFSDFIRNYSPSNVKSQEYIQVADELFTRLKRQRIKPKPRLICRSKNWTNSTYTNFAYQFAFQLLWALESNPSQDNKLRVLQLFISFITCPTITYESRLLVISSFAHNTKAGRGEVDYRFNDVFENILLKSWKSEVENAIRSVFNSLENDLDADSYSIYKHEENHYYVLTQFWSGNMNQTNMKEITLLRRAAKNGIKKYPEVIQHYWQQYPDIDLEGKIQKDYFPKPGTALYIPLIDLVNLTIKSTSPKLKNERIIARKWKKILQDPAYSDEIKQYTSIHHDHITIKEALINRNLI